MILNALDEVLFWDDIDILQSFTKHNYERFYPHDMERYRQKQESFFQSLIPNRAEFIRRLEHYIKAGGPRWISGRNALSDDIDVASMIKAISISSKISNGEQKAREASKWQKRNPTFWKFYTDNILNQQENRILELTIGAGGGTNAVMREMTDRDYYMGVDIDFVCAKNADALAKYYNRNGLGVATSLWNLPFEDSMFTSVCSNAGLEECREIPSILEEAHRVLMPGGKIVLHCLNANRAQAYERFEQYGFSEEERLYWSKKIRIYSSPEGVAELLHDVGFKAYKQMKNEKLGSILVFEK